MRLDSFGLTRGEFAIGGQEQFLIGEMRFFRKHNSPFSRGELGAVYLHIPFDAILFSLFLTVALQLQLEIPEGGVLRCLPQL